MKGLTLSPSNGYNGGAFAIHGQSLRFFALIAFRQAQDAETGRMNVRDGKFPSGRTPVDSQVAEEMAQAHGKLHVAFARVENALGEDDLDTAKLRMTGLLDLVRDHFLQEEALAIRAGLTTDAAGRVLHETYMERARLLLERIEGARCAEARTDLENRLVLLLSDLVENDLRLQRSLKRPSGPANANTPPGSIGS